MSDIERPYGLLAEVLLPGSETQGEWTLIGISQPAATTASPNRQQREIVTPFVLSGELIVDFEGSARMVKVGELAVPTAPSPPTILISSTSRART